MRSVLFRSWLVSISLIIAVSAFGAAPASAATTCKDYDEFRGGDTPLMNVRICAAPATDFPRYAGWGRILDGRTLGTICGAFTMFPQDADEPQVRCPMPMPRPVTSWKWSGSTWSSGTLETFIPGAQVYVYPYSGGWRWVWTRDSGWRVMDARDLGFRWRS